MTPGQAKRLFLDRHATLNAPADPGMLDALEAGLGIKLSQAFRGLYSAFNGLETADLPALFRLWSTQEIVAENADGALLFDGFGYHRIGDFIIHSETLLAALEHDDAPLRLEAAGEVAGADLTAFMEGLARGEWDFGGTTTAS